jgi:3-hydroxyanthranilate 3,4-dioxygenase
MDLLGLQAEKDGDYIPDAAMDTAETRRLIMDIVDDLPPVFAQFYASEEARTCGNCGALHPGKG